VNALALAAVGDPRRIRTSINPASFLQRAAGVQDPAVEGSR